MTVKPHASWFPWLLFAFTAVHSVASYTFSSFFGNGDEPLLYAVVAVLLWIERRSIVASLRGDGLGYPLYGLLLFFFGLLLYTTGQLYPVMILDVWGLCLIASGLIAALAPREHFRSAVFIGLSGSVLVVLGRLAPELLSSELAVVLASLSARMLDTLFFPVVSNGVTLYFGPYTAEVTDACSGMNSIFSLMALAVLYLREGVHRKPLHITVLVAMVIPVAILANLARVIMLVLVTRFIGDGFAHGWFHDVAGVMTFVVALVMLDMIDRALFWTGRFVGLSRSSAS